MNILIADERKKYHQALLNNGVLTIDKNGVPSMQILHQDYQKQLQRILQID